MAGLKFKQSARIAPVLDGSHGQVALQAAGQHALLEGPLRSPPARAIERAPRRQLRFGRWGLFGLLVVLPTVLSAIYLFAIASDQFITEARFVVRSAQKQGISGLGALLQGSGMAGIKDEAFPVIDFIKSRDALKEVEEKVGFRDMVSRQGADFLARFPRFYTGESFEELYEHYQNIVTVVHDPTTGITTLKVRVFEPSDSLRLAEALLHASEQLINRMNERSLNDAVSLASKEVAKAEERSSAAQRALTAYRISVGLVDMTSTAKTYVELVGGMQRELLASRAQLAQTLSSSPNNPGIQSLRERVAAIEQQIAAERSKLLGSDGSVIGTFAQFERLTLESEFAAKALVLAHTMLENSRVEALRKQVYLERVVEPNLSDLSRYPRRWFATLAILGTAFLAYAILWLLLVNAREHAS